MRTVWRAIHGQPFEREVLQSPMLEGRMQRPVQRPQRAQAIQPGNSVLQAMQPPIHCNAPKPEMVQQEMFRNQSAQKARKAQKP
jgi:hypothetical protein